MGRDSISSSNHDTRSHQNASHTRIWLACLLAIAGVFIVDLLLPLGVASGVPYVAAVLIAAILPNRAPVYTVAALCSALTISGYFMSPPGGEILTVIANRALALIVIWVSAAFSLRAKRLESLIFLQTQALKSAANPIIIVNLKGEIVWSNPAFVRLSGYEEDEVRGRNSRLLRSGKHTQQFYKDLWNTILDGRVWRGEMTNRRKDGTLYPEEMTITPVRDQAGAVSHFVAIKLDISERKQHEREIRLREAQLVQSEKMASLGVLSSGLAHEINNPNHVIKLSASLMADSWIGVLPILDRYYEENGDFEVAGLDFSEIRDTLPGTFADVLNSAERINTIVSELKSFASDDTSDTNEDIQLNRVAKSAATLLTNKLKKSTDRFSTHFEKDLPTILGNYQQMEQVLIHLLQNACDAITDRTQCITLSTHHDADNDALVVDVVDEGKGIPSDLVNRVMDPFFTTKRHHGGTGLGLSISTTIVKEHGGELAFYSTVGEGTTARITLPLHLTA